ncbi:MAG: ABC transporter substrate-binding protein [Mariprofundaceae bacterium]|nr:ABC transporter substrate-binding protein [Mariprofundaceae bacterium]
MKHDITLHRETPLSSHTTSFTMSDQQYINAVKTLLYPFMFLLLSACQQSTEEPLLRVGTNPWPGYGLFYLARDLGEYNEREVRLIELPSSTEVTQLLRSGQIDGAALTLDEALSVVAQGIDIKIILGIDFSKGADVILAKPDIKSFRDLKGKKVAVETTGVGAILLSAALEAAHLQLSDIQIVPTMSDHHYETFISGNVDAVVTFEPIRTKLLQIGAQELFSSTGITNKIMDVLVIRSDAMALSPQATQQLIDGYFSALIYLKAKPQLAAQRMVPHLGLSVKDMLDSYALLQMLNKHDNQKLFNHDADAFKDLSKKTEAIMQKHHLLQHRIPSHNLFIGSFNE